MSTQSLLLSFTQSQNIQIVASVFILSMLVVSLILGRRHQNQPLLKYAVYWVIIIMAMVFLYSFKDDYNSIKHRFISALIPSTVIEKNGVITIKRSNNGHFMIEASVNGAYTVFLIDTGATSVVLSLGDARQAGIDVSKLSFHQEVMTANGISRVAETKVDIKIGEFEVNDFTVLINSNDSTESLLGMSLINRFKSISVQSDSMSLAY